MTGWGSQVDVAAFIDAYRPIKVSAQAGLFARHVVAEAKPSSVARAKALLFAASRLAAFGASVGLECRPEVLLRTSVIERLVAASASMSPPTRRTLRTNLRALTAAVTPVGAANAVLPRERAKKPYSAFQVAQYLALADTQGSVRRRLRASGLICLGAGAGLTGADLRQVTGTDIVAAGGGLVVTVAGARARAVPILARYQPRLREAAGFFGDVPIVGGVDPNRRNVTSRLIASLSGGADLPRLDMGRLRSTWLAEVAAGIGLQAFMAAAGVDCSQRLGDIAAALPAIDMETSIKLLGGVGPP